MKARKTHPLCGQLGDMEQRLRAAATLQLDERTVIHHPHHARLVRAPHLQVIRLQGCWVYKGKGKERIDHVRILPQGLSLQLHKGAVVHQPHHPRLVTPDPLACHKLGS